jgi:hypothetical protein
MKRVLRLLLVCFVVALLGGAAYGFWWWRVQEMDSQRCAAALQAAATANEPGARYGPLDQAESWEERKYKEPYTLVEWIGNEYVNRFCD